ncbi:Protein always early 3 [Apostasia shenzhenica]|uniref:Protein always early 3 n=1 Tax=Apostasia shenzhenica TaxID=1088818 RepID=A0A2I0AM49_9ASPA|nr:Protein always early 3 [Apostasia shenzhenica]
MPDFFAGSRPRVVGKRTPRVPVPKMISPSKQGLKSESHVADDEGVHVAALALAEASQRGGSPQFSRTPARRRGHMRNSPVSSSDRRNAETQFVDSKIAIGQIDGDNHEDSLGSMEAENGEFSKDATMSETRKTKKLLGRRQKAIEDDQYDDDKEACSGTEEGLSARKMKDDNGTDITGGRASQPSKGLKKRGRQLFFDESSFDALQTLADLIEHKLGHIVDFDSPCHASFDLLPFALIIPVVRPLCVALGILDDKSSVKIKEERITAENDVKPTVPESLSTSLQKERSKTSERKDKGQSTSVEGAASKVAKLPKGAPDSKASSETKQQAGLFNSKIQKRKTKSMVEKQTVKLEFDSDPRKSEYNKSELKALLISSVLMVVSEEGKRSHGKVKRASQILTQPKQGKSPKLQDRHCVLTDLGRMTVDSNDTAVAHSAKHEVILPTKSRNRRKMDLKKAFSLKDPKSSESAVEDYPERFALCNRGYGLKDTLSHCLSSQLLRRWCKFEWFYSAIDYPWFAKSEFVEYLNHVKLGHIPRLTRVEWGVIRSSLGKPRRLSGRFLQQEREKLEHYRESVRSHYGELRAGVKEGLPTDLARPLSVGQRVIACHPRTREIHDGSILTVDRNRCRVQFDKPELGVEFVMDVDCMPMNPLENLPESLRRQNVAINKFCCGLSDLRLDEQKEYKTTDSLTFGSVDSLEAAEGASRGLTYSYPMDTLMNQAKGDTIDAIVQAKAAVNEVAAAAQQAMYSQPYTLAQIQAREADIRALADLSRTLDKKVTLQSQNFAVIENCARLVLHLEIERNWSGSISSREALLIELRQMNEEVSGDQKNGNHIKDLENFRKQYAMVLLQLRDVNDQVASALIYLRQRNTYERNSTLPWHKAIENSGQHGTLNSTTPFTNDSVSNVAEVIQSSRQKAKTMVDVAVQVNNILMSHRAQLSNNFPVVWFKNFDMLLRPCVVSKKVKMLLARLGRL